MSMRQTIENVIGSGLFSADDEEYFTWNGCDYCDDGYGATVVDCEGYESLELAKDPENLIKFKLCPDCLNKLYYK